MKYKKTADFHHAVFYIQYRHEMICILIANKLSIYQTIYHNF